MIIAYRSPLPILHLFNNRVIVIGIGCLDCLLTDRREVKIGNKSRSFLRVCAEKNVADTNVPVIDSKLTEGMETLKRGERWAYCGSILAYLRRRTRLHLATPRAMCTISCFCHEWRAQHDVK